MTIVTPADKTVHVITGGNNGINVTARTGPQGPQGEPGVPGPPGPQGEGIEIVGTLSGVNTPYPSNPDTGDTWIIGSPVPSVAQPAASGDGIVWDGDSWNNVGPLRGPQGEKGDKGDKGSTGATGATGSQGIKGDKGDTGSQGVQGVKGDKGDTGAASTVPGPTGPKGDKGDQGNPSTVPGPVGPTGPQGAPSTVPGPEGPEGDMGPPGIVMSPAPPPTTTVLWADTDEEGTGGGTGTGGVTDAWVMDADRGVTVAPGGYYYINFLDPGSVTCFEHQPLPAGWYTTDSGTTLRFLAGVYAFTLAITGDTDRDWTAELEIRYLNPISWGDEIYITPPPISPYSYNRQVTVSGTFAVSPYFDSGWGWDGSYMFGLIERPSSAVGSTKLKWQFSMVRLGDIPGYTGPDISPDTLMAQSTGEWPRPRRVPEGVRMIPEGEEA